MVYIILSLLLEKSVSSKLKPVVDTSTDFLVGNSFPADKPEGTFAIFHG